jgi:hypothetical protein
LFEHGNSLLGDADEYEVLFIIFILGKRIWMPRLIEISSHGRRIRGSSDQILGKNKRLDAVIQDQLTDPELQPHYP